MKALYKLILGLFLAVLLTARCDTDKLHTLNDNPNAVLEIDLNYFFTRAELGIASGGSAGDDRYIDWRTNIGMCAHCMQQLATSTTGLLATGDKYIDNDPEVNAAPFQWWLHYDGEFTAEILKQTAEGGYAAGKNLNLRQATRILRAFIFARLTDLYGSVPYSEANKGIEGIFFPKYDKQKDIYADCLKELDEAAGTISASNPDEGLSDADFIYNGDISKWKKFAYSVMLRMAMRISNVDLASANTYVTKALSGGVFTSNDDNMVVAQAIGPSEWTNQNGISRAMYPGDGGQGNSSFMSKTMVNWLKGTDPNSVADDDPRLMILCGGIGEWTSDAFIPYPGGTDPLNQIGLPNGYSQSMLDAEAGHVVDQDATYSKMNSLLLQDDEPYMIMNHAEVEFLLAEALEKGIGSGISGTAQSHYEAGVKSAMQMYTLYDASFVVSDASVNTYLATYPYGGTLDERLEMIGWQMWACHFMMWYEAWHEWKRTGYPPLVPTNYPGNDTNGQIPTKLRYPVSEVSNNPNYATGATQPDEINGVVWWDGGPE